MTQILRDLSKDELVAMVMAMQAKNSQGNGIKVRPLGQVMGKDDKGNPVIGKGNVAVYGLQKFPVTLFPDQWQRLAKLMPEILQTIEDNKDSLSWDK